MTTEQADDPALPLAGAAVSAISAGGPLRGNRDFRLLWTGQAVSALGSSLNIIVYPLLGLGLTGSATLAGLIGFAGLAGALIFRLPSGVLIDRLPLRRVIVLADLARAVTAGSLVSVILTERLTLPHLIAVSFLGGIAGVFADAGHSVAIRSVVHPKQLPQAFALNDARGHAVSLVGQPLGGSLYSLSAALPLGLDALSFVISALLIRATRGLPTARQDTGSVPALRSDLFTGMNYLWRDSFLRSTLLYAAAVQVVFGGLNFAIVASMNAAGVTSASIGAIFAVAAVGGLAGAVLATRIQRIFRPALQVFAMGWVATAVILAVSFTSKPWIVGGLLAALYLVVAPANSMLTAAQMHRTPVKLQGRVVAAALLVSGLPAPLGPLMAGLSVDLLGRMATFLVLGSLMGLSTIAIHFSASVRTMERPS